MWLMWGIAHSRRKKTEKMNGQRGTKCRHIISCRSHFLLFDDRENEMKKKKKKIDESKQKNIFTRL